jgi:protein-tyrosine phosphatase
MPTHGFIDIHCHLLPDLDDGPHTIDSAAQMCALAYASGTAAVVATPHANHRFCFDRGKTEPRRRALEQRIAESLQLNAGSEVEMSLEGLPAALAHSSGYTLAGSRYLLLELMPSGFPPNLERIFARLIERGIAPILAHPGAQRAPAETPQRLAAWVERGCLAQITGDSLTGRMGRRAQAAAFELLHLGLVHFVASDGHDPLQRPPRLLDAYRVLQ